MSLNQHDVAELRLIGEWLNARHPDPVDSDGDRVLAAADELERLLEHVGQARRTQIAADITALADHFSPWSFTEHEPTP